jgi:hypothetical protein
VDAVTLVVTVKFADIKSSPGASPNASVWWSLIDSISGEDDWWGVENTFGVVRNSIRGKQHYLTSRYVVPFGPNLRLVVWAAATDDSQRHREAGLSPT